MGHVQCHARQWGDDVMAGLARGTCTGRGPSLASPLGHKPWPASKTPPTGHATSVHLSPIEDLLANAAIERARVFHERRAGSRHICGELAWIRGNRRDASLAMQKDSIRPCCPSQPPCKAGSWSAASASAYQQEESRKHIAVVYSDGLCRTSLATKHRTPNACSTAPTLLNA